MAGGGRVLASTLVPTQAARPGGEVLSDAVAAASAMAAEAEARGSTVGGVGVGVPEIVDLAGQVTTGSVIDWTGEDVDGAFSHLGPVTVIADVRAAALAEAQLVRVAATAWWSTWTVGTGISPHVVIDGRPFPGSRGAALLVGSGPIGDVVLEDVAPRARRSPPPRNFDSAEEAVRRRSTRQSTTRRDCSARRIATLVNLLDPEIVVVGGGLGSAGGHYLDRAIEVARPRIRLPAARDLPIVTAGLGPEAGVVGAALASRFAR